MPLKEKDVHLIYIANSLAQNTMIIFTRTVNDASRLAIMLRTLGFAAVPLHGQLSQSQRLGALAKFKSGGRKILVATDVASRCVIITIPIRLSRLISSQGVGYTICRYCDQFRCTYALQGLHSSGWSYCACWAFWKIDNPGDAVRRGTDTTDRAGDRETDGAMGN